VKATSGTERRAALLLTESVLWLCLAMGAVGLLGVIRNLLAFGSLISVRLPRPTALFGRLYTPSLPATIDATDPELHLPVLAWDDTANGTVDAATGLTPVSISPPVTAQVVWPGPDALTPAEMLVWVAPPLVAAIGMIAGSWLLLRVVRSARKGEVFTMANAVRLRWLAGVVAVTGIVHNGLESWGSNWILGRSAAAAHLDTSTFTLSLAPVWVGLILAGLAVIWEHGVRLARDADGLV
jgi:hypothetical protein